MNELGKAQEELAGSIRRLAIAIDERARLIEDANIELRQELMEIKYEKDRYRY